MNITTVTTGTTFLYRTHGGTGTRLSLTYRVTRPMGDFWEAEVIDGPPAVMGHTDLFTYETIVVNKV